MKKIFSAAILALAAALALAGCTATPHEGGQSQDDPIKITDGTQAPGAVDTGALDPGALNPDSTPAVENTTAAGVSGDTARRDPVAFHDAFRTGGGSVEGTSYAVYTDYESLVKDFPQAAELPEHYSPEKLESIVVIAVKDVVRTGGYTVDYHSFKVASDKIIIDITEQGPGDAIVTTAFETHVVLIGVESRAFRNDLPIEITVNSGNREKTLN